MVADPTGYGRVIRAADGTVARVVEHKDAGPDELAVAEGRPPCTPSTTRLARRAGPALHRQRQGEEYLPDAVAILVGDGRAGRRRGRRRGDETAGVNDRVQLAAAHRVYNARLLEPHMRAGVTVVDPATTWVDAGVVLEPDVTLLPSRRSARQHPDRPRARPSARR